MTPITTPQPPRGDAVAAEVRALMGRHGQRQQDLADLLGVDQSGISRRLSARTPFTVPELSKIADHFDVELVTLFPATVSRGVA
jgi:transcriptional regulator with XRE-family HTH domain